jgi:SAM-dependent methyltransferase
VTSQRDIWDNRYRERGMTYVPAEPPSEFARRVGALLTRPCDVLELGCSAGWDAALFARLGHRVMATDFSQAIIDAARQRFADTAGLTFAVQDITEPLPAPDAACHLVYARLSLHYFDDATTRHIFAEIARVLRPNGLLAFMCKSTADRLYGKGEPAGPDMFHSHHLRHFFSEEYTRDLLAAQFEIESLDMREGDLYGEPSAWIEVVARSR